MFWSYMKQKTSNRVTVGPLVRDREIITDDRPMCEVPNQQYCSVFTRYDLANMPDVEQGFPYSEDHDLQDIMFTMEKVKAKLSKLKPSYASLFKKGSKGDPANYRPVSLTSVFCKLMESIIRDSIVDHLTMYKHTDQPVGVHGEADQAGG